jgi:alpha-beta hydrolase superfamily lysophospholipase
VSEARQFLFGYDTELRLEPRWGADGAGHAALGGIPRPRKLSYLSSGPVRVPALLALPASASRGAVVLQHGGGESKDDPLIGLLMKRWSAAGFTCLAIDAPGHGERSVSESPPHRRGFFEYLRSRVQNVIDLRRGIDLLQEEFGAGDSIGYWGVSMGGSVGVMLMACDGRVSRACLCLSGARSRRAWPAVDPGLVGFAAANVDPLALASDVTAAVLMLNGDHDDTIHRADAERLFSALAGPKDLHWFRTAHRVTPAMLRASGGFLTGDAGGHGP